MSLAIAAQLGMKILDSDAGPETQEVIEIAIAAFAVLLFALTLSAFRKTRLRRLLVVSVAFALFAVEVGILQLDDFVFTIGYATDQIVVAVMEFIILLLFFLAVIIKD